MGGVITNNLKSKLEKLQHKANNLKDSVDDIPHEETKDKPIEEKKDKLPILNA